MYVRRGPPKVLLIASYFETQPYTVEKFDSLLAELSEIDRGISYEPFLLVPKNTSIQGVGSYFSPPKRYDIWTHPVNSNAGTVLRTAIRNLNNFLNYDVLVVVDLKQNYSTKTIYNTISAVIRGADSSVPSRALAAPENSQDKAGPFSLTERFFSAAFYFFTGSPPIFNCPVLALHPRVAKAVADRSQTQGSVYQTEWFHIVNLNGCSIARVPYETTAASVGVSTAASLGSGPGHSFSRRSENWASMVHSVREAPKSIRRWVLGKRMIGLDVVRIIWLQAQNKYLNTELRDFLAYRYELPKRIEARSFDEKEIQKYSNKYSDAA